jgi:hypothetical protein
VDVPAQFVVTMGSTGSKNAADAVLVDGTAPVAKPAAKVTGTRKDTTTES